jgi:hypothetical protein
MCYSNHIFSSQSFRRKVMTPWLTFLIGSVVLTLVAIGGLLLHRRGHPPESGTEKPTQDTNILYALLWLASLSILAYISFTFGKR